MKITYYGHSVVLVEAEGKRIIIDPFLTGNPKATVQAEDVQVDAVLLTHGHADHFGDAVEIAKRNDCPVIAVAELAEYCSSLGAKAHGMNLGGGHHFDGFHVKFTLAFHSSSLTVDGKPIYMGEPAGILLTMGGQTFFHAGDTGLFGDMRLIGETNSIDAAVLPIGDGYTMGPEDALLAAKWLRASRVIPVHYNTFPGIEQDGDGFCDRLHKEGIEGKALKPGESLEF
ncbi:metal-dependent hydrolase [Paenibacillus polymyxa]|uniref:metal-dependent hydrolase n=1 Tax=Paenibacillus polymyxa TaxID=1406 RepID=UPI0004D7AEFE|nr:metal-dependent hydrolase [Paenibacillus polymyxa]KEO80137.1 metal-dependent hydrolase [Paenibacillus polymyxa]MCH6186242.1 metal-dependent hydrolase [Paenibacillus polymyxa]WRL60757.1 metal-dependent hydrolase [Paenibacillus polymyxa]